VPLRQHALSSLARFSPLLPLCSARLRLTIQDKNKYNTPKYRLVVRLVRQTRPPAKPYALAAGGCGSPRSGAAQPPL
jgi:hypothetical protein